MHFHANPVICMEMHRENLGGWVQNAKKWWKKYFWRNIFILGNITPMHLALFKIWNGLDEFRYRKKFAQRLRAIFSCSKQPSAYGYGMNKIWRFPWNPRRISGFLLFHLPSSRGRNFFPRGRRVSKLYIFEKYSSRSVDWRCFQSRSATLGRSKSTKHTWAFE